MGMDPGQNDGIYELLVEFNIDPREDTLWSYTRAETDSATVKIANTRDRTNCLIQQTY